jgi:hypothetical protein
MDANHADMTKGSYRWLGIELAIDFVIMYLVMYAMIATLDHFYLNLNTAYMALMMVTPMAVVMLFAMRSMFPSRRRNWLIGSAAAVIFVGSFVGIRLQGGVGDDEFLRSMIPHHSGAILMCRNADLTDDEIIRLCDQIITSQQAEIDQMEAIIERRVAEGNDGN